MVYTMCSIDEKYMRIALKLAQKAALEDEVPVGAILVEEGKIIARAYNKREQKNDPTMHAEIIAIRKACQKKKSWRLENCILYVTIEPCAMCAGTILWSRIKRVVYGAKDPKGGALGSSFNLFEQPNLNHHPEIVGGVLEEQCANEMKIFFQKKRI